MTTAADLKPRDVVWIASIGVLAEVLAVGEVRHAVTDEVVPGQVKVALHRLGQGATLDVALNAGWGEGFPFDGRALHFRSDEPVDVIDGPLVRDATDVLTLAVEGLAVAARNLNEYGNAVARERVAYLSANGSLGVDVDLFVDGRFGAAGFRDTTIPPCWDDCDGIFHEHRPGWCRVNPEHADFDCGCDVGDYDDYYDDVEDDGPTDQQLHEDDLLVQAATTEEPF
jgi:hypothetical protein